MDDIIFKKILHDDKLIEIDIIAKSEYASAKQSCYIDSENLCDYSTALQNYTLNSEHECYVQFGEKEGACTPAFSMKIIRADKCGHVKVEVDVEIEDNETRSHRCCFYVNSDIGSIGRFGIRIGKLAEAPIGTTVALNKIYFD